MKRAFSTLHSIANGNERLCVRVRLCDAFERTLDEVLVKLDALRCVVRRILPLVQTRVRSADTQVRMLRQQ